MSSLTERHFEFQVEPPSWFMFNENKHCRYCGAALLDGELVGEDTDSSYMHRDCFDGAMEDINGAA